jgi:hypothetical protein
VKLTLITVRRHPASPRLDQPKHGGAKNDESHKKRNDSDYEHDGRDDARGGSGDRRGDQQHHRSHDEPITSCCLHTPHVSHFKERPNANA